MAGMGTADAARVGDVERLRREHAVMAEVLESLATATRTGALLGRSPIEVGFIWCQNREALLAGETTWAAQCGPSSPQKRPRAGAEERTADQSRPDVDRDADERVCECGHGREDHRLVASIPWASYGPCEAMADAWHRCLCRQFEPD